jgi:hypothetical protein
VQQTSIIQHECDEEIGRLYSLSQVGADSRERGLEELNGLTRQSQRLAVMLRHDGDALFDKLDKHRGRVRVIADALQQ